MSYAFGTPITLPTTLADGTSDLLAAHKNQRNREIGDIEAVLGAAHELKGGQSGGGGDPADSLADRLDYFLELEEIDFGGGIVGEAIDLAIVNNGTSPDSQLDITMDEITLRRAAGGRVTLTPGTITIDLAASGANGLDTGTEAASTWYYVWLIWNGTTVAGLFSLSPTAPTMPGGYTHKGLVGAWRNNSSSNLFRGRFKGAEFFYDTTAALLSGGTAATETAVSFSTRVPPEALAMIFSAQLGVGSTTDDDEGTATIRVATGSDFIVLRQRAKSSTGTERNFTYEFIKAPNVGEQLLYLVGGAAVTKELSIFDHGYVFK